MQHPRRAVGCSLLCACLLAACGAESLPTPVFKRPQLKKGARERRAAPGPLLAAARAAPGGARSKQPSGTSALRPSFRWAVLHNWLYFLALGLTIPVLPRIISTIVNEDGSTDVSPASAVLGSDVEALDKIITFLCVGFLGALSDVVGRKPLMAYSALGFAATCYLQATTQKTISVLYLADLVDGVSSCMNTVCQAYVADASPPARRAVNIGIFQGLSVAGAFILGFPLSAVLAAKYGLRAPMYAASAVGVLNAAIALFLTPESLPKAQRSNARPAAQPNHRSRPLARASRNAGPTRPLPPGRRRLDLASANPLGALRRLFAKTPLLRGSASAFFLVWFSNACINSQFGNYVNHLFGWGPQESAPLLVLVGLMIAIAPPVLVPRLGLRRSIELGALTYATGLLAVGVSRVPRSVVVSVLLASSGCICIPSLIAFIANQAAPAERGALLGGLETLQELCEALAYPAYGRIFGYFISDTARVKMPGAPFLLATGVLLAGLGVVKRTFARHPAAAEQFLEHDASDETLPPRRRVRAA